MRIAGEGQRHQRCHDVSASRPGLAESADGWPLSQLTSRRRDAVRGPATRKSVAARSGAPWAERAPGRDPSTGNPQGGPAARVCVRWLFFLPIVRPTRPRRRFVRPVFSLEPARQPARNTPPQARSLPKLSGAAGLLGPRFSASPRRPNSIPSAARRPLPVCLLPPAHPGLAKRHLRSDRPSRVAPHHLCTHGRI